MEMLERLSTAIVGVKSVKIFFKSYDEFKCWDLQYVHDIIKFFKNFENIYINFHCGSSSIKRFEMPPLVLENLRSLIIFDEMGCSDYHIMTCMDSITVPNLEKFEYGSGDVKSIYSLRNIWRFLMRNSTKVTDLKIETGNDHYDVRCNKSRLQLKGCDELREVIPPFFANRLDSIQHLYFFYYSRYGFKIADLNYYNFIFQKVQKTLKKFMTCIYVIDHLYENKLVYKNVKNLHISRYGLDGESLHKLFCVFPSLEILDINDPRANGNKHSQMGGSREEIQRLKCYFENLKVLTLKEKDFL
jgi:hypothetical protein